MRNNQQLEQIKQTYVMIRRLHTLQLLYTYDDIDKAQYDQELPELLGKYRNLRTILGPNFDWKKFGEDFQITGEISIVNNLLQEGISNNNNEVTLVMEATSEFIRANDILAQYSEKPVIQEIRPGIERLALLLRTLCKKIKWSNDFLNKVNRFQKNYEQLGKRQAIDVLSPNELRELSSTVQSLYQSFSIQLKNR